jgi:hypothetical protein
MSLVLKAQGYFTVKHSIYPTCDVDWAWFYYYSDTSYNYLAWDFGDGKIYYDYSSNACNHVYNNPGFYTVTLRIFRKSGIIDTISKKDLIRVLKSPEPDFYTIPNPDSVIYVPPKPDSSEGYYKNIYSTRNIKFVNTTIKGSGDSLFYTWNFDEYNDSITNSNDSNPTHFFARYWPYSEGHYVVLTVKDNYGCERDIGHLLVIHDSLSSLKEGENKTVNFIQNNDEFTINLTSFVNNKLDIIFFNLFGQKVYQYRTQNNTFKIKTNIFIPGIYIISIFNEQRKIYSNKIIIH